MPDITRQAFALHDSLRKAVEVNSPEKIAEAIAKYSPQVAYKALGFYQQSTMNLFHLAAAKGARACLDQLIAWVQQSSYNDKLDFLLNAVDEGFHLRASASHRPGTGNTALHLAIHHGHAGCARSLIAASPRLATIPNKAGESPLHSAARYNTPEILESLLDKGAKLTARRRGYTVFDIARRANQSDNLVYLRKALLRKIITAAQADNKADFIALLELNELDIDAEAIAHNETFYIYLDKNNKPFLKLFLENCLKQAAKKGNLEMVEQLCALFPTTTISIDPAFPVITRAYLIARQQTSISPIIWTAPFAEQLTALQLQADSLKKRGFHKESRVLLGVGLLLNQAIQDFPSSRIKNREQFQQHCDAILKDPQINALFCEERRPHFTIARQIINALIALISGFLLSFIPYQALRRAPDRLKLVQGRHSFFPTRTERLLNNVEDTLSHYDAPRPATPFRIWSYNRNERTHVLLDTIGKKIKACYHLTSTDYATFDNDTEFYTSRVKLAKDRMHDLRAKWLLLSYQIELFEQLDSLQKKWKKPHERRGLLLEVDQTIQGLNLRWKAWCEKHVERADIRWHGKENIPINELFERTLPKDIRTLEASPGEMFDELAELRALQASCDTLAAYLGCVLEPAVHQRIFAVPKRKPTLLTYQSIDGSVPWDHLRSSLEEATSEEVTLEKAALERAAIPLQPGDTVVSSPLGPQLCAG